MGVIVYNKQQQRIIDYLRHHGTITPMEAITELGITKIATRIGEINRLAIFAEGKPLIKKDGLQSGLNRHGEQCRYMRYSLEGRQ